MPSEITEALAKVQADLPQIVKDQTATVPTKSGGTYSYSYADLADVSAALLPLLAKRGMAFTSCPTVRDDGRFVLRYTLMHTSGESITGDYPLTEQGGPQAQGSAITYARRYVLCAVTGVAPDDDDGQAAQQAATRPQPKPEPAHVELSAIQQAALDAVKALDDDARQQVKEWMAGEGLPVQFGQLSDEDANRVAKHAEELGSVPF